MEVNIPESNLIICMCEGGAETAIMDILLDNDMLIFNRDQLVEESVIPRTSVKEFQRQYLRREYDQKLCIFRVIDSRSEQFNLKEEYRCQVEKVIKVITAPEIEILIVVSEGKYEEFCKSSYDKPSEYCKNVLGMKSVKAPKFIQDYFANAEYLAEVIKKYNRVHKQKNDEASLYDLLKK